MKYRLLRAGELLDRTLYLIDPKHNPHILLDAAQTDMVFEKEPGRA